MNIIKKMTILPDGTEGETGYVNSTDDVFYLALTDEMKLNQIYTLTIYVKAISGGLARMWKGTEDVVFETIPHDEWTRIKLTFTSNGTQAIVEFSAGEYYFYKAQLEHGTLATDWTLSDNDFNSIYATKEEVSASIKVLEDSIYLRVVEKGEVSSQLSLEGGDIKIIGNRLIVESDNFKLDKQGNLSVENGTISGGYIAGATGYFNGTVESIITRTSKIEVQETLSFIQDDSNEKPLKYLIQYMKESAYRGTDELTNIYYIPKEQIKEDIPYPHQEHIRLNDGSVISVFVIGETSDNVLVCTEDVLDEELYKIYSLKKYSYDEKEEEYIYEILEEADNLSSVNLNEISVINWDTDYKDNIYAYIMRSLEFGSSPLLFEGKYLIYTETKNRNKTNITETGGSFPELILQGAKLKLNADHTVGWEV